MMKNWKVVLLLAAGLTFSGFVSNPAFAVSSPASIYIVHGIPGHDVSEGLDPALPVDVLVDGSICLVKGLKFGDIAGPFSIPANTYSIAISLANSVTPCSNGALLGPVDVTFTAGENASVVAYLSPGSTGPVPGVTVFKNNLTATPAGESRLIVQHTADAPAVDITVSRDAFVFAIDPRITTLAVVHDVTNGQQAVAALSSGAANNFPLTTVSLTPAGESSPVIGPYYFQLVPHTAYLIYAVGSLNTGSFTLITKAIPGV
jgi:hypothetical protein